jgi:hypothetical protein
LIITSFGIFVIFITLAKQRMIFPVVFLTVSAAVSGNIATCAFGKEYSLRFTTAKTTKFGVFFFSRGTV